MHFYTFNSSFQIYFYIFNNSSQEVATEERPCHFISLRSYFFTKLMLPYILGLFTTRVAGMCLLALLLMSQFICPHAKIQEPLNRFSRNFIYESFPKIYKHFQFWLKLDDNNKHFTRRFTCISACISSIPR
jgi:hypothetical protein